MRLKRIARPVIVLALAAAGAAGQPGAAPVPADPLALWLRTVDPGHAAPLFDAALAAWIAAGRPVARSPSTLEPGFHALEVPGVPAAARGVIVVPRSAREAAALPVAVIPSGQLRAPDEVDLRGLFGAWLDAGWAVLAPRVTWIESASGQTALRLPLGDAVPALIAHLRRALPVDTDRVVLVSAAARSGAATDAPEWDGDPTLFAGLHLILLASDEPVGLADPGRWQGRLVALHHSEHPALATRLFGMRLDELADRGDPAAPRFLALEDPALNWRLRHAFTRPSVERVLDGLRRPASPALIDFVTGPGLGAGFEWLVAPRLEQRTHLRARRVDADTFEITTPDTPRRGVFPLDLYLPDFPAQLTVSLNGRPVFGGPAPSDDASRLRAFKRSRLTGRTWRSVVRVRP